MHRAPTGEPSREPDEEQRLAAVYGRYGATERRRRSWNSLNAGNVAIRAELADSVRAAAGPWPRDRAVADLGCGTGWWLRELASDGFPEGRLHGLDALSTRIDAARKTLPEADLVQGDVRALPWGAESFWMATLFTVLSSTPSRAAQAQALAEAVRVLEPGGHLFIWEPRVTNPGNRESLLVRRATLRQVLGLRFDERPVTVVPALARRLGRLTPAYPLLSRTRVLCTHRLVHFRKSDGKPLSRRREDR